RTRELFLEHVGTVVPRDHRSSPGPDLPQRDLARRTGLQDLLPSMCMTSRWSPNPRSLYRRAELRSRGIHPRRLAPDGFLAVIPGTLTPPERRRSGRGAVVHSRPTSATTSVQGVRVSGPLDLLVQLAEQLEHDDLVAAADQLVGPDARVRPRPRLEHLRDRAR